MRDDYPEAVWLSAEVLQRVRAGQAPEAVAHAFAGTRSFLGELFPGQTDEVIRSAAALIAANRPRPLAEQRTRLGLTQAQVARRMGVRQERVSAIERAEPGATEVRTLASYVEALGGRLEHRRRLRPRPHRAPLTSRAARHQARQGRTAIRGS